MMISEAEIALPLYSKLSHYYVVVAPTLFCKSFVRGIKGAFFDGRVFSSLGFASNVPLTSAIVRSIGAILVE
jgi:hypothetical protein